MASKLTSTIIGALAYPAFLTVFGCAVVIFLAAYIIPDINSMLVASGGSVPRITVLLQQFAWFLGFGLIPLGLIVTIALIVVIRRHAHAKRKALLILLRVPVAGSCWMNWQLTQFCLVLRTLLASGVQLPPALVLASDVCGEGPVQTSARALRQRVLEGHDLGAPPTMDKHGVPPWLWRALAVGQQSGELVSVLERAGQRFEAAAVRGAARLGAVLEPLMILLVGAFVGTVAYAALLPIIRLNKQF